MTSSINFGAINIAYPVAGQDNDSQGFRGNFAAIQAGLSAAKSEIEDLQLKAVLTETLGTETDTVANNLNGSTISNGRYSQLNGVVPGGGLITVTDGTNDIDLDLGPLQVFKIQATNTTLTFRNWNGTPVVPAFSSVRIHLVSDSTARVVTFASESAGTVVLENTMAGVSTDSVTLNADGLTHTVVEAWSYDGDTVFVRLIGNFATIA
jgi:hypothetical protein